MKHRGRLHEVLRRSETGPIIAEHDFEAKLITSTVKRLIEKYNIILDKNTSLEKIWSPLLLILLPLNQTYLNLTKVA